MYPCTDRITRLAAIVLAAAAHALASAEPLGLEQALRIAESRSPQLAAQRAAAEAAGALIPAAGENPDPKLTFGIDNVPIEGADRWSLAAEGMTMKRIGVMQDFVRGEKRELRETKASAEARRELAILEMQRADLRREVATAWLERYYAERSQALLEALSRETELQEQIATAEIAAGKSPVAEGIAARSMRGMLADRLQEADQKARRAGAQLSRWLGDEAIRSPGEAPDVLDLPPHHLGALEAELDQHPHLAMYAPMEAAAEAEMRLAAAATKPDWSVELSYGQRSAGNADMVSLMFRTELPLFRARRQDPVTNSKRKQLEQVRAQAEDARRRHVAEIRASLVDWNMSRGRLARHQTQLVPLAEERARATASGYQGGRVDLAATLEARRSLVEAKLAALNAELEVARAWAQLAYLLPERKEP